MKRETEAGGLMAVGTFVVDYHKVVDHFPQERTSTRVKREVVSNGGAPLNLLINLAKLKVNFPLHAAAKVGHDLDGKLIFDCLTEHGVDISQVANVKGSSTGYTDVYTVEKTGKHTCFHFCGIGDTFARKDVKLRAVKPKMLFLGSLGALGKMDNHNPDFGRKGATQLIRDARKQGIATVVEISPIDLDSTLDDFKETLAEADYLIINDRMAELITGQEIYSDQQLDPEFAKQAAQRLIDCGIRKGAVIYAGSAAVSLRASGEFHHQKGYFLPWEKRAGSAGVDHAFSAGFLEGLFNAKEMNACLLQGLAVSTMCRLELTPSDGVKPLAECMQYCEELG